ncbi:hypothetical protein ACSBL2_09120 [Pedobacter sp. AW31-3R]|uniref:hypothetical protein n=1 Tax=Pedobacter sp. AW31-3R TaxID=3445781 RepID=UPI003FA1614A
MKKNFELYQLADDGLIPNSCYPLIVYHNVLDGHPGNAADFLEDGFAKNVWGNAFRWRVYDFHHYHTNTHEVLGVYVGTAELQLGGPQGKLLHVAPGDVLVLPAGTGHISLVHSDDFAVVGAYPGGVEPDLIKLTDSRPEAVREQVDGIPVPELDPVFGDHQDAALRRWDELRV